MKTLGDLGVLGEKKGFRPGEIIPVKKSPGHYDKLAIDNVVDGYNTAREEDNKISLKDILSKIEWDENSLWGIFAKTKGCKPDKEDCSLRKCSNWSECKLLVSALIKELPNMLKE